MVHDGTIKSLFPLREGDFLCSDIEGDGKPAFEVLFVDLTLERVKVKYVGSVYGQYGKEHWIDFNAAIREDLYVQRVLATW